MLSEQMKESYVTREYARVKAQAESLRDEHTRLFNEHVELLKKWNAVPEKERHLSRHQRVADRVAQCGADMVDAQKHCLDIDQRLVESERNLLSHLQSTVTNRVNDEIRQELAAI